MSNVLTVLAQAAEPAAESGDGAAIVGGILLLLVLGGIWNAIANPKKKSYDVRARVDER